jgi:hypothetical protein
VPKRAVPGVNAPAGVSSTARPPRPIHPTQLPGGSHHYRVATPADLQGGPGLPPVGFINGNNSIEEWYAWWAFWKLLKSKPGEGVWLYQGLLAGGGGQFASIKPDFIIFQPFRPLVVRVQSDRYHLLVNSARIALDDLQKVIMIKLGYGVIDIYPQHYMKDKRGGAVLSVCRDALNGRQRPNPYAIGTSIART